MTQIIVIGNSHVAALKAAWNEMKSDYPGTEVDFFAAPGRNFRRFRLLKNLHFGLPAHLRREVAVLDVSGRAFIDLSWAEHVVWAGYYWPLDDLAQLMRFNIDGVREIGAQQSMSRNAFEAFCTGMAEQMAPPPEWRNWARPRLFLLPAPMRSADCVRSRSQRFSVYRGLGINGTGGREAVLSFMESFGNTLRAIGIEMVGQPVETLLPNGLTDPRFARGSRKVIDPNAESDNDMTHVNAEYGKLQLGQILAKALAGRTPAPVNNT